MGLLDFMKKPKAGDNNTKDFNSITSEKANDLLKQLSGGKVQYRKRVIDNIIVVSSASGGAGASTIVANLAYTAATEHSMRVLVIDLNLLLPTQHMYFGIKQTISKPDLVGYLLGKNTLGDAIEQGSCASVLFANNRGLMDYINCESDPSVANFEKAIEGLRTLYDLIIIDSPMKVENTICNYAFYLSDQIYFVWDEGIGSIANTEKIRRNMASSGIDAYTKTKVILNKRTGIHYSDYPLKKLNLELVQVIPFEQAVILSSLSSEIFCDKGASRSPNAAYFCGEIQQLTTKVLQIGGLAE